MWVVWRIWGVAVTAPVLGVDPGYHDGAAVALDGSGRLLTALSWHRLERKGGAVYRTTLLGESEEEDGSLYEVGHRFRGELVASLAARPSLASAHAYDLSAPWYRLVVEGLFAWAKQLNGLVELAEAAGEVTGPLRSGAVGEVLRPKAKTWRASVLPKRWGTSSADAERAALVVCRTLHPTLGAFLDAAPDAEGRLVPTWPHVVEAACIARWGWAQGRLERRFVEGA